VTERVDTIPASVGWRETAAGVAKTAVVAGEFALLVLVIWRYAIESEAFVRLCLLALAGFVVHASLPRAWRMPFFSVLSVASVFLVFGIVSGLWLLALGLGLITLSHLPIPWTGRIALLLATAAVLVLIRVGRIAAPWSEAIWPILGSMFMFRLLIYLYDLKHEKAPFSLVRSVSYFFMLPNICFPLFPVVDYTRFNKHHYDADEHEIYQRGVHWMFRGIVQLLLYRLVYHRLTVDPAEVIGLASFIHYSLATFLLYLRVSGLFHLIVGMLLLFGFNLHETHHLYYLSSSFTDFWRRINIYWKDFMVKLFYYPIRFQLRRLGEVGSIVVSTIIVFAGTWFLHAYQWFWLRGDMLLEWHDALFWAILAGLVIVNSLYDLRYPPPRSLGRTAWDGWRFAATTSRTIATFTVICLLWSLWSSDSLGQWVHMVATTGGGGVALFAAPPMLLWLARWLRLRAQQRPTRKGAMVQKWQPSFRTSAGTVAVGAAILVVLGQPAVYQASPYYVGAVVRTVMNTGLNTRDQALLDRGYYEHLLAVNRQNSALRELFSRSHGDQEMINETPAWRDRGDFVGGELVPGVEIQFRGHPLKINRWGMRDQDYALDKPPGVFRIAALGASALMGWGAAAEDLFEARFETALNASVPPGAGMRFEVLNFGTPSSLGLRQVVLLEEKVAGFHPDAIFYFGQQQDPKYTLDNIAYAVFKGREIPFAFVQEILERTGVEIGMARDVVQQRLAPYRQELIRRTYGEMVAIAGAHGVTPVWVYLPWANETAMSEAALTLQGYAQDAGFVVVPLDGVYDGYDEHELQVAEWDRHPNALGHRLLAETLYREVHDRQEEIFGQMLLDLNQHEALTQEERTHERD